MSTALVLGGGGPLGIAWQAGLLAGLARQGVELSRANFVLGTSAGSVVGAALATGRDLAALPGLVSTGQLPVRPGTVADLGLPQVSTSAALEGPSALMGKVCMERRKPPSSP